MQNKPIKVRGPRTQVVAIDKRIHMATIQVTPAKTLTYYRVLRPPNAPTRQLYIMKYCGSLERAQVAINYMYLTYFQKPPPYIGVSIRLGSMPKRQIDNFFKYPLKPSDGR